MSQLQKTTSRLRKMIVPGLIAVICLSFFMFVAWTNYNGSLKDEKSQATEVLSSYTNGLSSSIKQQIDKAQSLVIFTQYTNEQDMLAYTNQLYSQQSELVQGWLLTENAKLINADAVTLSLLKSGSNLANHLSHKKGIERVLQTRRTVLVPHQNNLSDGSGSATINCYIPIFSYENNLPKDIKGIFIVLLNVNRLMGQSGLLAATRTYQFALYQEQEATDFQTPIFNSYGIDTNFSTIQSNKNAVILELDINNTTWKLFATPIEGWQPNLYLPMGLAVTGLVLALLSYGYLSRLINSHDQLNQLVDERTKQLLTTNKDLGLLNSRLEESLDALHSAQEQLIRNEKLASLGGLVAGVAHEINTPLGVAVTVSSFLHDLYKTIRNQYQTGGLSRHDFLNYLDDSMEGFSRLDLALQKSVGIIRGFKTVAIDQTNMEVSKINLLTHLETIISSLSPKIQEGNHKIQLNCPIDLNVVTFPMALFHIFSNLITNSLIHGFEGTTEGLITLDVTLKDATICIRYADNGCGIPNDITQKVFEPFFTTKRLKGCTGLGLHIVNNMTTQVLKGQLTLESPTSTTEIDTHKSGAVFTVCLPNLSITHN